MIVLAGLAVVALSLGAGAGSVLSRNAWSRRIPRVAALAWLGALTGTLAALIGMVVVVSTGRNGLVHRAIERLADCWHHPDHPGGPTAYGLNLLLLAGTLIAAWAVVSRYRHTVTQRRRHREALQFVVRLPGGPEEMDDVCVLDHPIPVAYCVPARSRPIVLSSGALERLNAVQLQAVLAHERAHLRYRHHLFLASVDALAAALSWLPTFRSARRHLPLLLEMSADDVAAGAHGRQAVAVALRKLAIAPSPAGTLAAGASRASELDLRLDRLETSDDGRGHRGRHLTWIMATTSAALPILISAGWVAATPFFC